MMRPLNVETLELSGVTVIEASAGTGKTYTITSLFLRLLLEQKLSVDQILVVTYTRAATAELRERIRARLGLALRCARGEVCDDAFVVALCERWSGSPAHLLRCLETALANIEQAPVLTIHAFCQRVLRDQAFESSATFGLQVTAHAAPIIDEIVDDYYTAQLFDTDRMRAQVLVGELDTLRTLATRAGSGPGVRIIPEQTADVSISLGAWSEAQLACRTHWQRDREELMATVRAFKGTSAKNVELWSKSMDQLLAGSDFGFSRGPQRTGFGYFTRSAAREKAKTPPLHPFFDLAEALLAEDERLLTLVDSEKVAFRAGFVRYLRHELERRARENDLCTFDALITEVARALTGEHAAALLEALKRKYHAALVDEFQDTDPAQYQMFRRVFGSEARPLLLIGDPKQAIYAFRGADVLAYLEARGDAGERVFTLEVNRRSDAALVSALNTLYTNAELPFLQSEIAYLPVQTPQNLAQRFFARDDHAPLDIVLIEGPGQEEALRRDIARKVAADIARLISSGARRLDDKHGERVRPVVASDIAVLCRTNREAHEVQLALSVLAVPSVLSGDSSVFDSDDAEHIERALSALAHPTDPRPLRAFLCSIYAGMTAEGLLGLERDDAAWDAHARNFRELHELFVARGFTQALRTLCARYRVEERLLTRPDGLRRLTNLQHLGEILAEVSLTSRLGPLGLLRWLQTARQDADVRADLVAESHELRLESNENAVQLTTVHKSKGLEYPIVYCPYLFKPANLRGDEKALVRYHDPNDGVLSLDLGSSAQKEHAAIAETEALAEALRLLYVALTRAKHRVVVALPCHKPNARAALVYTLLGGGSLERVGALLAASESAGGLSSLLRELARKRPEALSVRTLEGNMATATSHALPAPEALTVRNARRVLDNVERTASFSALVSAASAAHEPAADYDALSAADDDAEQAPSPLVLDAFPRGAGPGKLIHEVLEHCSFDAGPEQLGELAQQVVKARGFDPTLVDVLVRGLGEALATPLDTAGLTLASIAPAACIQELEFLFPVSTTLTPKSLARCFRTQHAPSADPSYARRIEGLSFEALRGHLRGFIDLVFEHEGRFYLVDYKSNRLGGQPRDYATPGLTRAMSEHHYFLQYHLYALALHRYLGQRLPHYQYARHFGGVFYLFLRGMAPSHAPTTGVFFDLPPAALIDALDRCMTTADTGTERAS